MKEITARIILVEIHAEATSEKLAMGWMLDGRVSAVWGTHTHVPTADVRVLPGGTGYVTDLGMTGPANSVLGIRPELSIAKFRGDLTERYKWPTPHQMRRCSLPSIPPRQMHAAQRVDLSEPETAASRIKITNRQSIIVSTVGSVYVRRGDSNPGLFVRQNLNLLRKTIRQGAYSVFHQRRNRKTSLNDLLNPHGLTNSAHPLREYFVLQFVSILA